MTVEEERDELQKRLIEANQKNFEQLCIVRELETQEDILANKIRILLRYPKSIVEKRI